MCGSENFFRNSLVNGSTTKLTNNDDDDEDTLSIVMNATVYVAENKNKTNICDYNVRKFRNDPRIESVFYKENSASINESG